MRPIPFLVLLVVTVAVTLAAIAGYVAEDRRDSVRVEGEPVLPGLRDKVAEVARVEVVTGGELAYALERRGEDWVAANKHGYPVEHARVSRTLIGLAELEKIAPKTRRPDLYPRIHVEDPRMPGATSRLVRLLDADGRELAALIVGKQRHARTGRADSGTYVRRPETERAWLAAGLVDLSDDVYPWLDTRVVDIPPGRVRRIEIVPRTGGRLLAIRPERDAPAMGIADVPSGRQPDVAKVRRLGSVLAKVKFDDVRPAGDIDFAAPLARAEVTTFDGVSLAVDVVRRGGAYWLRLSVGGDAEIARRVEGWAYKVADYIGERLSRSLEDVLHTEGAS